MYAERDEETRSIYLKEISEIDPKKIVYIDESGMNDNDAYPYAYSPKGEKAYSSNPGHSTKRLSMIGALNEKDIHSPFIIEGYCNTAAFEVYVESILVPNLKSGQVVIMDNASFHKSTKTKELIEGAGCKLLFLPPYSPDLNPIEHWWHKIKTIIRKKIRDFSLDIYTAMTRTLQEISVC